jgi:hypothetical protein
MNGRASGVELPRGASTTTIHTGLPKPLGPALDQTPDLLPCERTAAGTTTQWRDGVEFYLTRLKLARRRVQHADAINSDIAVSVSEDRGQTLIYLVTNH